MQRLVDRVRRVTSPGTGVLSRSGSVGCLVTFGLVLPLGCGQSPALPGGDYEAVAREIVSRCDSGDARPTGPVYVALRSGGVLLVDSWTSAGEAAEGGSPASSELGLLIARGLERCAAALGPEPTFETAEVSIPYDHAPVDPRSLNDADRGLLGLEIQVSPRRIHRIAPSRMIAENLEWNDVLGNLLDPDAPSIVHSFRTRDFLVTFDSSTPIDVDRAGSIPSSSPAVHELTRGNQIVSLEAISKESTEDLALGLASWLGRNVDAEGRLTYKYWPSTARESDANNVIRQFLGNVCLQRLARAQHTPTHGDWLGRLPFDFGDLARRNLEYDLAHFYVSPRTADGIGYIRHDAKVKLGAAALAGLAIHESPTKAQLSAEAAALFRFTHQMWSQSGAFRTFLEPEGRNDCQNFYPGETLYYWSQFLSARTADDAADEGFAIDRNELASRLLRSVAYYRDWHLRQPNPAFIPWHTRACFHVWKESRDPALADWIFRMNDWLLGVQQWEDAPSPDMIGRFYAPGRPFGPPHASSTGVYMEGLVDAFALARALGDDARTERYRRAIWGGIRSAMQLQFRDEIDLYYVRNREHVEGALRTTVYDNEIRVDNVQHVLMALLDILTVFEEDDYPNPTLIAMRMDRD